MTHRHPSMPDPCTVPDSRWPDWALLLRDTAALLWIGACLVAVLWFLAAEVAR